MCKYDYIQSLSKLNKNIQKLFIQKLKLLVLKNILRNLKKQYLMMRDKMKIHHWLQNCQFLMFLDRLC